MRVFTWAKSPWKAWLTLVVLPLAGAAPLALGGMWFEAAILLAPALVAVAAEAAMQAVRRSRGLSSLQNRPAAASSIHEPRRWFRGLAIAATLFVMMFIWATNAPRWNATATRNRIRPGMSEADVLVHTSGRVIVLRADTNRLSLIFLSPLGTPPRSALHVTFGNDRRVVAVDGPRSWSD